MTNAFADPDFWPYALIFGLIISLMIAAIKVSPKLQKIFDKYGLFFSLVGVFLFAIIVTAYIPSIGEIHIDSCLSGSIEKVCVHEGLACLQYVSCEEFLDLKRDRCVESNNSIRWCDKLVDNR